jgi:hypothetical protein
MTTTCDHADEDGLYLQPLAACLAPTDADRAAYPELDLPRAGDPVVITGGHVMFLGTAPDTTRVATDNSILYGAPMTNAGCGAAQWAPARLVVCEPGPEIEPEDAAAIQAAWHLLIDLANHAHLGGDTPHDQLPDTEAGRPAHATTTPNPDAPAPGPVPNAAAVPDPLPAIRLAAADTLDAVAHEITDETGFNGLLAAIEAQARAAAGAHEVTGDWNLARIQGAAIIALYTTTLATGEAIDALRGRLGNQMGTAEVRRRLDAATRYLRP